METREIFRVKTVYFSMIHVEGGTFTMGATPEQESNAPQDEYPTHQVTLNDYYIGEIQVTQRLWKAVMDKNPSWNKGGSLPVECISWNDCQEFIHKLNSITCQKFRLPTEAEWEFAARGGNKSSGYKYSGSNNIENVAWCSSFCNMSQPVGTKSPNELGIYDMSGNVWEWCNDRFGLYSKRKRKNPIGPRKGYSRVLRGGSWISNNNVCRVSFRARLEPVYGDDCIGLRLALSAK